MFIRRRRRCRHLSSVNVHFCFRICRRVACLRVACYSFAFNSIADAGLGLDNVALISSVCYYRCRA